MRGSLKGLLIYFIYRLKIRGARGSNTLEMVILDQNIEPACSDDDAEIIFGEMVEKGEESDIGEIDGSEDVEADRESHATDHGDEGSPGSYAGGENADDNQSHHNAENIAVKALNERHCRLALRNKREKRHRADNSERLHNPSHQLQTAGCCAGMQYAEVNIFGEQGA